MLIRIIISAILLIAGLIVPDFSIGIISLENALFLISFMVVGYEIVFQSIKNIFKGEFLDECFLMSVAGFGAMAIGEFPEAAGIVLFYNIGEYFSENAREKSCRNIEKLLDLRTEYANIMQGGELIQVSPNEVKIGTLICVKPGERIPLDGILESEFATLDTSSLTGESIPLELVKGSELLSGAVNLKNLIEVKTTKIFIDSTVSRILQVTQNAEEKKAKAEKFITRFAKIYTPVVVGAAVLLAVIPSLITGNWNIWIERALSFLVVSCPCALVVSVPLSYFGGIGACSKNGILIKGGTVLDNLCDCTKIAFDKTGTLTTGDLKFTNTFSDEHFKIIASLERFSNHPAARAVMKEYKGDFYDAENFQEVAGHGVSATVNGKKIEIFKGEVMIDNQSIGFLEISDNIRHNARDIISKLKKMGIAYSAVISGDKQPRVEKIAEEAGIENIYAELLPDQKLDTVRQILPTIYVGDGINDAPALIAATVGIAMGGIGSDAAIESADAVILSDNLNSIPKAIGIARHTRKIVLQNIWFAIGIKILIMLLTSVGITDIRFAIFADVGVMILAVLNAVRVLKYK